MAPPCDGALRAGNGKQRDVVETGVESGAEWHTQAVLLSEAESSFHCILLGPRGTFPAMLVLMVVHRVGPSSDSRGVSCPGVSMLWQSARVL